MQLEAKKVIAVMKPESNWRAWQTDRELSQGASVSSHKYHKNPLIDALNPEQNAVIRKTTTRHSAPVSGGYGAEYERGHQWREATRELVLVGATAIAEADPPQSQCSISITLTGNALSNELLLADTGTIALTSLCDRAYTSSHPMRVLPMRLDLLSDLPAIRILGHGVTEPTRLRLVVELTACNPHTDIKSVMTCEYDSVLLDAQTPLAVLDFRLQAGAPHPSGHADSNNSEHRVRHEPDWLVADHPKHGTSPAARTQWPAL